MWQRHEEYEVCLVGGGRRWVCWQDFTKFKRVADFCAEIDRSCSKAWVRVLMSRFHYRSLDREHLALKCSVLEMVRDGEVGSDRRVCVCISRKKGLFIKIILYDAFVVCSCPIYLKHASCTRSNAMHTCCYLFTRFQRP